jgi:hypothetical protein
VLKEESRPKIIQSASDLEKEIQEEDGALSDEEHKA